MRTATLEPAIRSADSTSLAASPSSLVVDVTHRPPASYQPSRQATVAADVSFEELQYLMHSPSSPLSPESPDRHAVSNDGPLPNSLEALQLDQQQHFNALLLPGPPSESPRPSRSLSASPPSSAVCSSSYSSWRLHMIDFEYSSYNPRAFDLANHVCEHYIDYAHEQWPGFLIDEQRFPSDHHIRRFITAYLHHYKKQTVRSERHILTRSLPAPPTARTTDDRSTSPFSVCALSAARLCVCVRGWTEQKDSRPVTDAELDSLFAETMWFTLASHFKSATWRAARSAHCTCPAQCHSFASCDQD